MKPSHEFKERSLKPSAGKRADEPSKAKTCMRGRKQVEHPERSMFAPL